MQCQRSKTRLLKNEEVQLQRISKEREVKLEQKCNETGVAYEPVGAMETPAEQHKRIHRTRMRCARSEGTSKNRTNTSCSCRYPKITIFIKLGALNYMQLYKKEAFLWDHFSTYAHHCQ